MQPDSAFAACRDCHCLAARRQARAITRLYDARLRPHGLRATQFSVLAALAVKGPTPVKALAGVLGLERTTLTRIAALLERNGWIGAAPAVDNRERRLRLTAAGRRTLQAAFPAWKAAQDEIGRLQHHPSRGSTPAGRGGRDREVSHDDSR